MKYLSTAQQLDKLDNGWRQAKDGAQARAIGTNEEKAKAKENTGTGMAESEQGTMTGARQCGKGKGSMKCSIVSAVVTKRATATGGRSQTAQSGSQPEEKFNSAW